MEERGLTLKDLERPSGLDRQSIRRLVLGERKSTSFEVGMRIAAFLKVDPWSLMPGVELPTALESESGRSPHTVGGEAEPPWMAQIADLRKQMESIRQALATLVQVREEEDLVGLGPAATQASPGESPGHEPESSSEHRKVR